MLTKNLETYHHDSKGFFEIIGVKVTNTFDREVGKQGWMQPIIGKKPWWNSWITNEKN